MIYAVLTLPIPCDLSESSLDAAAQLLLAQQPEEPVSEVIVASGCAAALVRIIQSGLLMGIPCMALAPGMTMHLPDGSTGHDNTWAVYGTSHVVISGVR